MQDSGHKYSKGRSLEEMRRHFSPEAQAKRRREEALRPKPKPKPKPTPTPTLVSLVREKQAVGAPLPPFHANCRCQLVVNKEDEDGDPVSLALVVAAGLLEGVCEKCRHIAHKYYENETYVLIDGKLVAMRTAEPDFGFSEFVDKTAKAMQVAAQAMSLCGVTMAEAVTAFNTLGLLTQQESGEAKTNYPPGDP